MAARMPCVFCGQPVKPQSCDHSALKLERGQRQPSLALFLRISSALGITGTELLSLVEPKLPKSKR